MNQLIGYLIAALLVSGGAWAGLHEYTTAITERDTAMRANETLAKELGRAEQDRIANEQAATIYADRAHHYQQQAQQRAAELEELKNNDQATDYLAATVPDAVAGWLWLRSDCESGTPCDYAAILSAKGYAEASTTTDQTIQWCSDTDAALDKCNADKAQIREWVRDNADIDRSQP